MKQADKINEIYEVIGGIKTDTQEIKDHLAKLNGRVLKHDIWIANWNGRIRVLAIILTAIVFPIIIYIIQSAISKIH